jgi:hypothetical protein
MHGTVTTKRIRATPALDISFTFTLMVAVTFSDSEGPRDLEEKLSKSGNTEGPRDLEEKLSKSGNTEGPQTLTKKRRLAGDRESPASRLSPKLTRLV